jgi:signal transduction histidine kinase
MERKRFYFIAFVIVFTLVVTYLHYSIFRQQAPHVILEELYYIPVLLGSLLFGLKGALLTYLFVSAVYLPYLFGDWVINTLDLADRFLHLLFSGIFAFLAGFLIDRGRKYHKQLERDRYLAGLGQVAAMIVHDLRNPLISISAFARRIREGKGDTAVAAKTIENSARNMQKIVEGVLDFSRPIQLELKGVDTRAVIDEVIDSCKTKAEERGVTLLKDIPATPLNIVMDSFQIQRALINLINNAIEASEPGREVIIKSAMTSNHVVIRIKDSGAGMDSETLENAFVPFYSKKNTGTGLGLTIAKKIVEGHSGKIHVKSRPGLGTEVIIELPYRSSTDSKP